MHVQGVKLTAELQAGNRRARKGRRRDPADRDDLRYAERESGDRGRDRVLRRIREAAAARELIHRPQHGQRRVDNEVPWGPKVPMTYQNMNQRFFFLRA